MKKILFLAFTVLCVSAVNTLQAQTQRGYVIMGADLAGLNLDFQEGNTSFGLNITPKAGWFIADNRLLGVELDLGLNTAEDFSDFTYGIGAFGRYYFGPNATNLVRTTKWFAEANVGIFGENVSVSGNSTNTNGLGLGFGPGLAYFITPNVSLEGLAKYNLTVGFGNSTTNNRIGVELGFQIYLPGRSVRDIANDPLKNK